MPYEGPTITEIVTRLEKAVHPSMMQMADDNGANMTRWIIRNTPVEGFVKNIGERHLRDRIFQKETIVFIDTLGRKVYETGTYTEVDYAPFVEEDTQPHEIRPKPPNTVLTWIDRNTGQRVFARKVEHPGTRGAHMFAIGAAMAEHEFERASAAALRQFERIVETGRVPLATPIPLVI